MLRTVNTDQRGVTCTSTCTQKQAGTDQTHLHVGNKVEKHPGGEKMGLNLWIYTPLACVSHDKIGVWVEELLKSLMKKTSAPLHVQVWLSFRIACLHSPPFLYFFFFFFNLLIPTPKHQPFPFDLSALEDNCVVILLTPQKTPVFILFFVYSCIFVIFLLRWLNHMLSN